jgi:UPF0755 protein
MRRFVFLSFILLLVVGLITSAYVAFFFFTPALSFSSENKQLIITRQDSFPSVIQKLEDSFGLKHPFLFAELAKKMNVDAHIRPAVIAVNTDLLPKDLAKAIRQGGVKTVDIVIRGLMDIRSIPRFLSSRLEPNEQDFNQVLFSDTFLQKTGFDSASLPALFIPDTYNMYWFTEAHAVYDKLFKAYLLFWDSTRLKQSASLSLTPIQVATLASIVDKETSKTDEMPRIAGVYLNRLAMGWKLQADPTVKFALDSPSLKRILTEHTLTPHPYNTYYVEGLPPGPICIPSKQATESVLNPEKHSYVFFCAKPDFSGYHVFASTYEAHQKNAKAYHRFLNQLKQ